ncbi:MAG: zf-HC2 domain-containing protein, partial [Candidatus Aminicenantes bacterium]|nr:zf-HC2 domain-containing protein [Candidatus Aminicenantes bacterium]
MRHEKIRKLLGAFLDKELDAEYIKVVENHLNTCPKCREELTFLKKMEELSGEIPSIPQEEKYWASFPLRVKNGIKQIINEDRMKEDKMFQDSFIQGEQNIGVKAMVFPLSMAAHLILVLMLVIYPLLNPGAPPQVEIFSAFLAPPPPPPPP